MNGHLQQMQRQQQQLAKPSAQRRRLQRRRQQYAVRFTRPVPVPNDDAGTVIEVAGEVTELLEPYDGKDMNAFPISPRIKNPRVNEAGLLTPVGPTVLPEADLHVVRELKLQGMGYTKRDDRPHQGATTPPPHKQN